MATPPPWSKGSVRESRIDFTDNGPVTSILFVSSIDGVLYCAQFDEEVVVLYEDLIETQTPPDATPYALRWSKVIDTIFPGIRDQFPDLGLPANTSKWLETLMPSRHYADELRELRTKLGPFFAAHLSVPTVRPQEILDSTRRILYKKL